MSKFTPGPWTVERYDHDDGSISYEVWNLTKEHYGRIVSCNDLFTHPNSKANARLIAAAPDLLEALKALVHVAVWDEDSERDEFNAAYEHARAAISRATE